MIAYYKAIVTGSAEARKRWPTRIYKLESSAQRRCRQIESSQDPEVRTTRVVWYLNR